MLDVREEDRALRGGVGRDGGPAEPGHQLEHIGRVVGGRAPDQHGGHGSQRRARRGRCSPAGQSSTVSSGIGKWFGFPVAGVR